jgi:hypothetical protein
LVDKKAKHLGFCIPEKVIDLNRFRRFEYEYEYREAEYEKAEHQPTKIPEGPNLFTL